MSINTILGYTCFVSNFTK